MVQVDPIKPTLKPPGTKRLKLKNDATPSKFAFNFNLRRYTPVSAVCRGYRTPLVGWCYDKVPVWNEVDDQNYLTACHVGRNGFIDNLFRVLKAPPVSPLEASQI
jgi:hypothetical protein